MLRFGLGKYHGLEANKAFRIKLPNGFSVRMEVLTLLLHLGYLRVRRQSSFSPPRRAPSSAEEVVYRKLEKRQANQNGVWYHSTMHQMQFCSTIVWHQECSLNEKSVGPRVTKRYKQWKACHFCHRSRPEDESGWKFVPVLLDDPQAGGLACPKCYIEQSELLVEAGILILVSSG